VERELRNRYVREVVETIVMGELKNLHKFIEQLEPRDKINLIKDLIPYVIPKYAPIEYVDKTEESTNSWKNHIEQLEQKFGLKKVS